MSADADKNENFFKRIATYLVFLNSSIDKETVAKIVSVSKNGKTLIYTDGKLGAIGFVNLKIRESQNQRDYYTWRMNPPRLP